MLHINTLHFECDFWLRIWMVHDRWKETNETETETEKNMMENSIKVKGSFTWMEKKCYVSCLCEFFYVRMRVFSGHFDNLLCIVSVSIPVCMNVCMRNFKRIPKLQPNNGLVPIASIQILFKHLALKNAPFYYFPHISHEWACEFVRNVVYFF